MCKYGLCIRKSRGIITGNWIGKSLARSKSKSDCANQIVIQNRAKGLAASTGREAIVGAAHAALSMIDCLEKLCDITTAETLEQ